MGFCFLISLLVNVAAFIVAGWVWRSPPAPSAAVFPRLRMVRLAWKPAPPPPLVPPVLPPPAKPIIAKPIITKPHPIKPPRPKKPRRPGARVHSTQPAPAAAPSRSRDSGAPAPAAAAPPAAPAPLIVTTERPAPIAIHPVISTPIPAFAPVAANVPAPPTQTPIVIALPAALTGHGAGGKAGGGNAAGKGAGKGAGSGEGAGAGNTAGRNAGEPFGIGKGIAGDGTPRHVVYVLDTSGSMRSRIDRAEAELRRALDGLRPGERFNIVAFSDTVRSFDSGMVSATPDTVQQASNYLDTLQARGGTNLEAAMLRALTRPGVNEIVLLTDGVPTDGETDFKALAREFRQLNSSHARISAVGLVGRNPDGTDDSFEAARLLQQIADDSGGTSKLVTLGVATP